MSESIGNGNVQHDAALDGVFAELIRQAEAGEPIDEAALLARHPQWAEEICEFLSGRAELEQFAAQLGCETTAAVEVMPPGVRIRYFGDYELLEELGHGGMGYVYRARQVSLGREVALKFFFGRHGDRARFEAEVRAAAVLDHPNIVSVYETGEHEGRLYYTMQLVEGNDLRRRIERGPMEPKKAAALARKLAAAVQYAHDRGVLHRDLKPANVLLDADEEPRITDFGLAKLVDEDTELTRSGAVLGTPSFMAPEQASGDTKSVTTLTDVYGLGTILYAMLTGRPPFVGLSSAAVLRKIEEELPQRPRSIRNWVPLDLETICLKCLDKESTRRYGSARALTEDLERFERGEPIQARPVSAGERAWRWCRRNPVVAGLSAAVVALLTITAVGGTTMAVHERLARNRETALHEQREAALYQAEANLIDLYTDTGRRAQSTNIAETALWYAHAAIRSKHHPERFDAAWRRASIARRTMPDPVYAMMIEGAWVRSLKFHPHGGHLLVRTNDGRLLVCDLATDSPPETLGPFEQVTAVDWTPDGNRVVIGTRGGDVAVVQFPGGIVVDRVQASGTVRALALSKDGSQLAAAVGNTLRVWNLEDSLKQIGSVDHPQSVLYAEFNPDGSRVLTQCVDRRARVFAISADGIPSEPVFPPVLNTFVSDRRDRSPMNPRFVVGGTEFLTLPTASEANCYDAETGKRLRKLDLGTFRAVATDSTGQLVAAGGSRSVSLWAVDEGVLKRNMGRRDAITTIAFSPDSRLIAVGGYDYQVALWLVASTTFRVQIQHHAPVAAIAFSADSRRLATAQEGGLVRVWSLNTRGEPPHYTQPAGRSGSEVRISPLGDLWFASGDLGFSADQSELQVRRIESGQPAGPTLRVPGVLRDADMSGDQTVIAAVSSRPKLTANTVVGDDAQGRLSIWNWPEGTERISPVELPAASMSLAMHPSGDRVAVHLCSGKVLVVRTSDGQFVHRLSTKPSRTANEYALPGNVCFAPDGDNLVAWDDKTDVWVWDATDGGTKCPPLVHPERVTSARYSADGKLLASASANGSVRVWDMRTGKLLGQPVQHPAHLYSVRFNANGNRIITACADDRIRIFESKTGRLLSNINNHSNDVFDALLTPDDRWLISAGDNHIAVVTDARDARFMDRLIYASPISHENAYARRAALSLSPDGRFLIVAGKRTSISVVDFCHLYESPVQTPEQLYELAELTASKTIRADDIITLTADEWLRRWEEYKGR